MHYVLHHNPDLNDPNSLKYMHKLSVYILVGYKLVYNHSGKYLTQSNGIYYFIRRVPTDVSDQLLKPFSLFQI